MILNGYKKSCFYFLTFYVRTIETAYLYLMMLGSKGILTPLIPNCCVLCTPAILKTFVIRSFFSKMASYSCFGGSQVRKSSCKQALVGFLTF